MTKRLLIVAHAPSENTLALRAAVERGARSETGIDVVVAAPLQAGPDDVLALQAYLYACVEAEGDPSGIPEGPWDEWTDRHFDVVNIERAAMLAAGDASVPPSMLRSIGLA